MITKTMVRQEFKKQNLSSFQDFINLFMSPPISDNGYIYLSVKTMEGISMQVWGNSLEEVWNNLQRFNGIKIFI